MQVFATVLSGVAVYILGQLLIRFSVEPLQELKRVIGDISHALVYYADVYSNPGLNKDEIVSEARKALRDKASVLRSQANVVPFYDGFTRLKWVPSRADIKSASRHLIGLSNSLVKGDPEYNDKRLEEIKKALRLDIDD